MGMKEQKGWVWTPDEKQWIKTWEQEVRAQYKRLAEQVERFKSTLPGLAAEAAEAAQPFLSASAELLAFAHGAGRRTYQPLSPDEARQKLREVYESVAAWITFTRRADVEAAIRDANRQTQAQNRKLQKQRSAARTQIHQELNSPEFAQALDQYVAQLFELSEDLVVTIQKLPLRDPFGTEADLPLLQRLLLVHFLRSFYQFNPKIYEAMATFVRRHPTPTLAAVVRHTFAVVIRDHWDFVLRLAAQQGSAGSHLNLQDLFTAHLQSVCHSLMLSIQQWQKEGVTPHTISHAYFTILGADYSLEAQPE